MCGNSLVETQNGEQCDDGDGMNTGGYGKCAPGCVCGPYCGDGKVQLPYEERDDKNNKKRRRLQLGLQERSRPELMMSGGTKWTCAPVLVGSRAAHGVAVTALGDAAQGASCDLSCAGHGSGRSWCALPS